MNGMSLIGVPPPPSHLRPVSQGLDYTVLHGLRAAVEVLSEMTENQLEKQKSLEGNAKLLNRCRVICLTSARDNESMNRLEEIFHNVLQSQNKLSSGASDRIAPIDFCHLVIINTFPVNIEPQVGNHAPKMVLLLSFYCVFYYERSKINSLFILDC